MGGTVWFHPSGDVDNGANRYVTGGSPSISVAVGTDAGGKYVSGGPWVMSGSYDWWSWSGSTFSIGGANYVQMHGGNPGTAGWQTAYWGSAWGSGSWSGGMGGHLDWAWNPPGQPSLASASRSSDGLSLTVTVNSGSGRVTGNYVSTDANAWNGNGTTFSVGAHSDVTYYGLSTNEDRNSGWANLGTSRGICTAPSGQYATRSTSVAGRIDVGVTTGPTYTGAGVTSYKTFRDGVQINNGGSTFSDTGLTRGQTYNYTFKAVNSTGDGVATTAVSAVAPGVPGAPSSISVGTKVGRTITINHAQDANGYGNNVTEYRMQLSTDNGATWKGWDNSTKNFLGNNTYNTTTSGAFTYQLLTPALTYKWRAQGVNSIGSGDYVTIASGTFVGAGGKRFDGTNWNPTTVSKRFDGTNWIDLTTAKRFDGTNWVDLT